MHCAAHYGLASDHLVEEHVFIEGAENDKEVPLSKPRMGKATPRPEQKVLAQKVASGLHGSEVTIGDLPSGVDGILLKLPFYVRNEIARLADTHDAGEPARERTRSRRASKSRLVSGVVGLPADPSNQASSSGVMLKGMR